MLQALHRRKSVATPAPAEEVKVEFYTAEEASKMVRQGTQSLVILFAAQIFSHLLFHIGFAAGFMSTPILMVVVGSDMRRKIRRGESVAKPAKSKTPLNPKVERIIVYSLITFITGGGLWATGKLLPFLFHPRNIIYFIAAAYLQLLVISLVTTILRAFYLELPNVKKRRSQPGIVEASVPAESIGSVTTQRRWWTESGLREEIQVNRRGSDR